MKSKVLVLFVIVIVGSVAVAIAATSGQRPSDPSSLRNALLHGKINYLQKESRAASSKSMRTFARLSYLAARMQTDELSSYAAGCFQSKKIRKKSPVTAFTCGLFAASAGLSNQNVSQWAQMLSSSLTFGLPVLQKQKIVNSVSKYPDPSEIRKFIDVPLVQIRLGKRGYLPWVPCLYETRKNRFNLRYPSK